MPSGQYLSVATVATSSRSAENRQIKSGFRIYAHVILYLWLYILEPKNSFLSLIKSRYRNMSTVSVVIPTFNRENFIKHCVVSALQQSKTPDEVIVVDDGSSDKTWDILRALVFLTLKIREIHSVIFSRATKVLSAARNLGIKASKYNYIAFLDSDDVWLEKKLEKQISSLESHPTRYRLSHTNEIWIRNGVRVNAGSKHEKSGGDIFAQCLKLCCISPSSSLVDRSVFDEFGLFDEMLPACEDYDFGFAFVLLKRCIS